jgi:HAD superfamily hydrolase (TIGR01509 family)
MKNIHALIFDCDGVLFESHSANLAYYNRVLAAFAYPPVTAAQQEAAHLCHTASSPQVLAGLMRQEDVAAALAYAAQLDYREFIPLLQPEPHVRTVLDLLAPHYPLAIATNRGSSVIPLLQHFDLRQFFSVIVTSHDVKRPKPAPDMLLLAARQLNRRPGDCLFIGDSELDRSAAEAGSFPFAGYGAAFDRGTVLRHHLELPACLGLPVPEVISEFSSFPEY